MLAAGRVDINAYDRNGRTPLMVAVVSDGAPVEVVEFLLASGADLQQTSRAQFEKGDPVAALAVRAGDAGKVALLIRHGADFRYTRAGNYDAIIDAAYSRSPQTTTLLKLLIAQGLTLNKISAHNETALGQLSRVGKFNEVELLLDSGADPTSLGWTDLHRSVVLGSLEEVASLISGGANLEERDKYDRTPFLLAAHSGDVAKAELLLQHGANPRACGRFDEPAIFLAIEGHHDRMVSWLLRIGADAEQTNEFGSTPLITAVEQDNRHAILALLEAGVALEGQSYGQTALAHGKSREVIRQLLDAGADPRQLGFAAQRILVGLGESSEDPLLEISKEQFLDGRLRRFGRDNPERMDLPFWIAMIRSGASAYLGAEICDGSSGNRAGPVWSAHRFGQSLTRLPDGRIIQIAGEHEDHYDEDFCIYNDIFVHDTDGTVHIYGYPETVFPPIDFHTATLIGRFIYIIGSLGYQGTRQLGHTPVYRLDTDTLKIDQFPTTGDMPGRIYGHRATHISAHEIRISGGTIVTHDGSKEIHLPNDQVFVLDVDALIWRRQ